MRRLRRFAAIGRSVVIAAVIILPCGLVRGETAGGPVPANSPGFGRGYSAAALFDAANAFARAGHTGLAVLNYERAQLLAPNDPKIAANLNFVRAKADLPPPRQNGWDRSLGLLPPNRMAWVGTFGFLLSGLCLLLAVSAPRTWRTALGAFGVGGALLVAAAIGCAITTWPRLHEAVVLGPQVAARNAPVAGGAAIFQLREGEIVELRAQWGDFALVQTPAGGSGWVARRQISRVVPD
jgi:hypothetical protein